MLGKRMLGAVAAAAVMAGTLAATPAAAALSQLSANWYTLGFGHADTERSIDSGIVTGLVLPTLGPNGLPVRARVPPAVPAGTSRDIVDVDAVTNEIQWWTPGVRTAGTVTLDSFYPNPIALPINQPSNLFPGGLGSNANPNGYTAAHLFGTFIAPSAGTITLTLGADDDAWVFINGQLVVDLGGVKALTPAPVTVAGLAPGVNRIDLFFADRHAVQSGLEFSADVAFTPIPEPATLALLGLGLAGLALARRRRAA